MRGLPIQKEEVRFLRESVGSPDTGRYEAKRVGRVLEQCGQPAGGYREYSILWEM